MHPMRILFFFLLVIAFLVIGGIALAAVFFIARPADTTVLPAPATVEFIATPTLAPAGVVPTLAPAPVDPAVQPTVAPIGGGAAGPFTGTFEGTLQGDGGSSAPVTLTLAQDGASVSGEITVGQGLAVDAGNCGSAAVPSGAQRASGQADASDPNHLAAAATFDVQGISVTANLDARLDPATGALAAQAMIDLPFLCGRDPVISGTLARVQ